MVTAEYHFEGVHSATCSEDGQVIVVNVTGADGRCALAIPAKAIPQACVTLLEANAEALRRTGDPTIQASEIRAMEVRQHPDPDRAILAITIHTGAAPVSFSLPEKMLVNFARGVLERRGLLAVDRPSKTQ